MTRAQRIVVLVVSCLVSGSLFFGVPKQGHEETRDSEEQKRWGKSFDSIMTATRPARLAEADPAESPYAADAREYVAGLMAEKALGPRPTRQDTRFIHEPDANEVLLRYVLPLVVLGVGLFVLFGKSKEARAA